MKIIHRRITAILLTGVILISISLTACQREGGGESASAVPKRECSGTVTVCLVRHGQTIANTKEILADGNMDSPLTDKGLEDARDLGEALARRGFRFDEAWASGLGRTQRTAKRILAANQRRDLSVRVKEGLNDISWGKASGRTQEEVRKEFGDHVIADYMYSQPGDGYVSPLGAEDKQSFVERFDTAMTEICEESLKKTDEGRSKEGPAVLVTAHSSAAFWLAWKFPDAGVTNLDNVSATVLRYRDGQWTLRCFNQRDYDSLAEELMSKE